MGRILHEPITPGARYTLLTAIKPVGKAKDNHMMWLCKCDCGKYITVRDNSLKCGRTHSCGCYSKASPNKRGEKYRWKRETPIGSGDRLYRIYWGMKTRCSPGNDYYERGVRLCDEWADDYLAFKRWAYANGFDESADGRTECSIDRIDNDGDYTPENCRWATSKIQSRNKRTNVKYLFKGEMLIVMDIAKIVGLSEHTIKRRLAKGMTIDEATTLSSKEVRKYGKNANATK